MSRPKTPQTSADVEREIRRLLEAKERLIADEDQRRGALLREYLARPNASDLRDALVRFVGGREGYLFGIDTPSNGATTRTSARGTPAESVDASPA
jgi:hypothetical protein